MKVLDGHYVLREGKQSRVQVVNRSFETRIRRVKVEEGVIMPAQSKDEQQQSMVCRGPQIE